MARPEGFEPHLLNRSYVLNEHRAGYAITESRGVSQHGKTLGATAALLRGISSVSGRNCGQTYLRSRHGLPMNIIFHLKIPKWSRTISFWAVTLLLVLGTSIAYAEQRIEVQKGDGPIDVAVSTDGATLYVANYDADKVGVRSVTTQTLETTVTVGNGPVALATSPNGNFLYVANELDDSVSVIATATNTVSATVSVGDGPDGLAVSPDSSTLYVSNYTDGTVSVIATATNTVSTTINVGSGAYGLAVSPDGSSLFVANEGSDTVSVIATATNTVSTTVNVGDEPEDVVFSPDGSKAYVPNFADDTVSVIATATNTVSATISVGDGPIAVAMDPDGETLYVSTRIANAVDAVNLVSNTVATSYAVGNGPVGLALTPNGNALFVANYQGVSISRIDLSPTIEDSAPPSVPGIYLYVAGPVGRGVSESPIYFGAVSIAPDSSYILSLQSVHNSALTRVVLASGMVSEGGHLESRLELTSLDAGTYKIVFTGTHRLGYPLILTNYITVNINGDFVSISPESLQPSLS